jgi:hypothetical protein
VVAAAQAEEMQSQQLALASSAAVPGGPAGVLRGRSPASEADSVVSRQFAARSRSAERRLRRKAKRAEAAMARAARAAGAGTVSA